MEKGGHQRAKADALGIARKPGQRSRQIQVVGLRPWELHGRGKVIVAIESCKSEGFDLGRQTLPAGNHPVIPESEMEISVIGCSSQTSRLRLFCELNKV